MSNALEMHWSNTDLIQPDVTHWTVSTFSLLLNFKIQCLYCQLHSFSHSRLSFWCHSNPGPHIAWHKNDLNESHTVRNADFKLGKKRALVSSWYSVLGGKVDSVHITHTPVKINTILIFVSNRTKQRTGWYKCTPLFQGCWVHSL